MNSSGHMVRSKILLPVLLIMSVSTSCLMWWGDWADVPLTHLQKTEALQDEEFIEVDVELHVGTLQIEPGSFDRAYELDLRYNELAFEPRIIYERDNRRGRFQFDLRREGRSVASVGQTRLNLRLNRHVPVGLRARTAVAESQIDLTGLALESLRLETGVGETVVLVLDPNPRVCRTARIRSGVGSLEMTGLGNLGFEHLEFQGGVGSSTLDFSGSWDHLGEADIEVGVGEVEIRLPRHIGAEIEVSENFLSHLSLSGFSRQSDDLYVSDNIDRVQKVLRLRVRTGIGSIEIRWI